jgi:hypothetical protein
MEKKFIDRVVTSWNATNKNMGVLLNGIKGTGKTVTAQLICNKMELPVIIIPFMHDGLLDFLNSIQQDVIILIDEYEKIFKNASMLLSIMDGVFKNNNRFMFLFTTNDLHIEANMLQRPSRIRYIKTFSDMTLDVIMEVVNDKLLYPEFNEPTVRFISEMPIITMDLVKSVVEEVNIHAESPYDFADVFNIHDNKDKLMNVYVVVKGEKKLLKNFCDVSPSYFTSYSINQPFIVDGWNLGSISSIVSDTELFIKTNKTNMYIDEPNDFGPSQNLQSGLYQLYSDKTESDIVVKEDGKFESIPITIPSMTVQILLEPAIKKHKSFSSYSSYTL